MTTKTPTKPYPSYTAAPMLLPERTLFKNDSETVIRLFLQLGLLIMAIILCIRTALLLVGLTPALHPFNVFSISSKIFQALPLPGQLFPSFDLFFLGEAFQHPSKLSSNFTFFKSLYALHFLWKTRAPACLWSYSILYISVSRIL